ncbi:hypothetical protein EDD22DRAFT_853259 [Suillus occidentalis]|nr:hypothetical protein EDD22DRAFT_853259 [Suillus occidentalis]
MSAQMFITYSCDFPSMTHPSASTGSWKFPLTSTDINPSARFQEGIAVQDSKALASCVLLPERNEQPVKRKMEFADPATPRKQRILESFSTDGPMKMMHHNTDITSPAAKHLYREASGIFLKRKADAQIDPFTIKRVKVDEPPPNARTFIWSLPMETLSAIVSLLRVEDLHTLTQVSSRLREIAGPIFFANRNFSTSPEDTCYLHVDSPNFDILTTWRRMDTFRPPRMVLSWIDVDVRPAQLSAFLDFLQSVPRKSIRFITLFWSFDILSSLIFPQIINFLENIRASSCEELMCMGLCRDKGSSSIGGLTKIEAHPASNGLKCFDASSRVFFSPQLLPFTMQTIHSSSLEKLGLRRMGLSPAQWDKLLRYLSMPMLIELRVDADCAPGTLIHFLACHPDVKSLCITPGPAVSWRTPRRATAPMILSMSVLDGPLPHILSILRQHHKPPSLESLEILLQSNDALPDYMTAILRCLEHCDSIGYLALHLPAQSHHRSKMMCHPDTYCVVLVRHLEISYCSPEASAQLGADSAGDPLALSAPWIGAFPKTKRVSMRGESTRTVTDLVHSIRSFVAKDVQVSVQLQDIPW